jgi:hypothetical protein
MKYGKFLRYYVIISETEFSNNTSLIQYDSVKFAPYFYGSILLRALKSETIVLLTYIHKK